MTLQKRNDALRLKAAEQQPALSGTIASMAGRYVHGSQAGGCPERNTGKANETCISLYAMCSRSHLSAESSEV